MIRKWLQKAIDNDYLPVIATLDNTAAGRRQADALNQRIRQDWDQHGATDLTQKQGLSDELRRYLKDTLGPDHWVLNHLGLTTQEYAEINDRKQGRVQERNEATQQLENPDAIVARAVALITGKHDWPELAAGLAVLTGRRVAEILSTAQFEKQSQWSVTFRGALKRRGEEGLMFEIPTLTTADRVIKAMERLRTELPEAVGMEARAINRKYEQAVAKACDRAFADLVPTREGKDTLYTHLFRAVYATIASFWYCPPSVNETEFRAAIQGHYAIQTAKGAELRRSLAASRHYADYEIADSEIAHYNGQRKGIKLGLGGVQPIAVFRQAWESGMAPKAVVERKGRSSFRVWQEDKVRLEHWLERFTGSQPDKFHAFLNWLEEQKGRFEELQPAATGAEPAALVEAEVIPIQTQVATTEQHTDQIDSPPIAAPPTAPSTDSKIDRLIDTMEKFIDLQLTLATAQTAPSTPLAKRSRTPRPKADSANPPGSPPPAEGAEPTERQARSSSSRAGAAETTERINRAINAIMAYNDAPGRKHTDKWAIGINTLKAFVKSQEAIVTAIGGRNRKGEDVVGTRQAEITAHHHTHQIDPTRHNYYHRGKHTIDQVLQLE